MNDDTPKELFAVPRLVTSLDECLFYHTMDVPGHGTVKGYWDIRGNESQYLGGVEFRDKRVLEVGPASGQLSFFMEREGAEVVSLEAAEDYAWEFCWDSQDAASEELQVRLDAHRAMMERLKNSYWFCHRVLSSNAKVHYGSAYSVPRQLGEFDISVLACILLHNKNPLRIIENCARVTGDTMIVVEVFRERPFMLPFMEFLPTEHDRVWHDWWGFAPSFLSNVLRSMGFPHTKITFHTQKWFGEPAELFTVVASRSALKESAPDEAPANVQLSCPVERLRVHAGRLMSLPLSVLNLSAAPLSSFSSPPTLVSYHWRQESGEIVVWDGLRTPLPRTLDKGDSENIILTVKAPETPGIYVLEISMLKEHVTWYDDDIPGLPLQIETVVTP